MNVVERQMANAARLLRALDQQRDRESAAYRQGYLDGHTSGWETGYRHAHHEVAVAWSQVAERVRETGRTPTQRETDQRRSTPGGIAYTARLQRHGHEYQGGPVDWETGLRPLRRSA